MKNVLIQFSRIFVGILFIISGLIKLNDPIGFSYKLNEYFSPSVFNIPFLEPYTLAMALFLVVLEVVLGLMLLLGYKPKFTVWSLLLLIVGFSFLTFYSAYFDVVKDCGCFGDALHLTPWQSFTKDIILLFFILIVFFNYKKIKPLFWKTTQNAIVVLGLALSCFMGYWVINHLPIIDFRPFKIGTKINQSMQIPANAPKSVVEMVFVYNVNGKNQEFTEKDLANIPANATFVERKDKIIVQGYQPPIHDFKLDFEGQDRTQEILSKPKSLLIIAYNLAKSNPETLQKINSIAAEATKKGYYSALLTGSSADLIANTKAKNKLALDILFCDETALKTIERANPSFIVLHQDKVIQKVHFNDLEDLKL